MQRLQELKNMLSQFFCSFLKKFGKGKTVSKLEATEYQLKNVTRELNELQQIASNREDAFNEMRDCHNSMTLAVDHPSPENKLKFEDAAKRYFAVLHDLNKFGAGRADCYLMDLMFDFMMERGKEVFQLNWRY